MDAAPGQSIGRINLLLGPLAGIEADQLCLAFTVVAAGTPCAGAVIEIETIPVQVRCRICRTTSQRPPNRLICGGCGAWQVDLVSGNEMLLAWIEAREEIDV